MKPVVTTAEMRAVDASASVPESVLIDRAGWHVAAIAKQMMGGNYGRHVVVVAGPGNNGADGRVAAELLRARGARVRVVEAGAACDDLPHCGLVIDAAFGTGFHGQYNAPNFENTPVLAVDMPSGVNGDSGVASPGAVSAAATVTFAGCKPGHFLNDGPQHCGEIYVCDIGLQIGEHSIDLIESTDVPRLLARSARDSHKWKSSVAVVAGSPGMMGAALLSSAAATRAGAGMVRLLLPRVVDRDLPNGEAVASGLPTDWVDAVLDLAPRLHGLVVGPGLGRDEQTVQCVRRVLQHIDVPVVIDADGLYALGSGPDLDFLAERTAPTVLTPHDGEFKRLAGEAPGSNRIDQVRALARQTNSHVLLKGSTTTVATPEGKTYLSIAGSARLATAGTGDVLSGIVGAFIARGVDAPVAAALAAHVHGRAAQRGYAQGLVAGDLPELVAAELSEQVGAPG